MAHQNPSPKTTKQQSDQNAPSRRQQEQNQPERTPAQQGSDGRTERPIADVDRKVRGGDA